MAIDPPVSSYRLRLFERKTLPAPPSDCVVWTGGMSPAGYGIFWNGARLEQAHRFAYRAAIGPIDAGAVVRHSCDNPACVNAAHLLTGSQRDNVDDMLRRKRHWTYAFRGEHNPTHKLTEADVAKIRQMLARRVRHADIAALFGVHKSLISLINTGKAWACPSGSVAIGSKVSA